MFSLIITIISIALVAALAVATIYYGGSAFTQGSSKAAAATMVSQAQQIAGAVVLFENDNPGTLPTVADLVGTSTTTSYLSTLPVVPTVAGGGAWAITATATGFSVTLAGVPATVCNYAGASNGAQYYCNATGLAGGAAVAAATTGSFAFND